jgi:cytoskeletal protein RodZ
MSLGQAIVKARNSAGMTVDELAKATNLRPSLLKEFEGNDFINAGGDTYARGHLKIIARVLAVAPDEFLDLFDHEHAQVARNIHEQLVENNATFSMPEKSKYSYKQVLIAGIAGIVILLGGSLIVNSLKNTSEAPKPKPSASAKPTPTPSGTPSVAASANAYSSGSGVLVKLSATTGSTWLFVSDANGVTLYSGRAAQGQAFEFSSNETVNLRIGNAGAVKLTVNGKEVAPLGGNGEVVNVSYGVNS